MTQTTSTLFGTYIEKDKPKHESKIPPMVIPEDVEHPAHELICRLEVAKLAA